jgi:CRP-like cAMP-binding protein
LSIVPCIPDHGFIAVKPPRSAIRSNRLLSALSETDRALLLPYLKEVSLQARDVLHDVQDEIHQVLFPGSGMVSILAVTDDGDAIESASVGSEGAVGAIAALGIRHASSRAMVQISGEAMRIAVPQLQQAATASEGIRDMIVRSNEAIAVQMLQTAACGALHDVEARLARWLLQANDRSEGDAIPLIQEQLAQLLGVRRTTINVVVGSLQDAGLVRYRRGGVEVLDRGGLTARSCSCYRIARRQIDRILPPARA